MTDEEATIMIAKVLHANHNDHPWDENDSYCQFWMMDARDIVEAINASKWRRIPIRKVPRPQISFED